MNRISDKMFSAAVAPSKVPQPQRKKSSGWININFSAWETEQLKALAECKGIPFRQFLEQALRAARREAEKLLSMKGHEAVALSKNRREKMGAAHRLLNGSVACVCSGSN